MSYYVLHRNGLRLRGSFTLLADFDALDAAWRLGYKEDTYNDYRLAGDPRGERFALVMSTSMKVGDSFVLEAFGVDGRLLFSWEFEAPQSAGVSMPVFIDRKVCSFVAAPSGDLSSMCPTCLVAMVPEHAHYRCSKCGYRDSCCM